MPLGQPALKQALVDLFTGKDAYPADITGAGKAWAKLYAKYAEDAVAGTTFPVATALATAADGLGTALKSAFEAAYNARPASLSVLVPKMVKAFTEFWPAVGFAIPGVLGVATSPPLMALTTSLTTFFAAGNPASGPKPETDTRATDLAQLLHTWTKTVSVINTPTGSPPLPPVLLS